MVLSPAYILAPDVGDQEPIFVDIVTDEKHSASASVSNYPVESGGTISDSMTIDPQKLNMTGMFSSIEMEVVGGGPGKNQNVPGGRIETKDDYRYFDLLRYMQTRQVLIVNTGLRKYLNMVLTNLEVTRNKDTGGVISFTASFQEVVFANAKTVQLVPIEPTHAAQADVGDKTTPVPDAKVQEQGKSMYLRLGQGIVQQLKDLGIPL